MPDARRMIRAMRTAATRLIVASLILMAPHRVFAQAAAPSAATCERLASIALPNATITLAQVVQAGAFVVPDAPSARGGGGSSAFAGTLGPVPPVPGRVTANTAGLGLGYNGGRGIPAFTTLPAFCRVAATLKPSPASDIRMETWLPLRGWNGNFRGTSPNGLGGVLNYNSMAVALTDGFAVAGTDTGHQGGATDWMQVSEKVTDFAGRAMHETTVAGKALTAAFYGTAPKFAYMLECGGGSAAALHEVQKYPADYDGVRRGRPRRAPDAPDVRPAVDVGGGAPERRRVRPAGGDALRHPRGRPEQVRHVGRGEGRSARETRRAAPSSPQEIACRAGGATDCLTPPQVEAVRKIYQGPMNPRTKERIWSRLFRGSELDWGFFAESPRPVGIPLITLRDAVLKDPNWDYRTSHVDYDRHVAMTDQADVARVSASNPDIAPFVAEGGKLMLSGGWNNALVPAGAVLDYFQKVQAAIGAPRTQQAVRLYMVPGMIECNGGPGTDTFDMLSVDAALGRARPGAPRGTGVAGGARQGRAHAAALPVSPGGHLHGPREHGRSAELRV